MSSRHLEGGHHTAQQQGSQPMGYTQPSCANSHLSIFLCCLIIIQFSNQSCMKYTEAAFTYRQTGPQRQCNPPGEHSKLKIRSRLLGPTFSSCVVYFGLVCLRPATLQGQATPPCHNLHQQQGGPLARKACMPELHLKIRNVLSPRCHLWFW